MRLRVDGFKRDKAGIEDALYPGNSKSAVTLGKVEKVHDIALADRQVIARELAEAVGILVDRVNFILYHKLHMKKLCTRWVPRLLFLEQKGNRMKTSAVCLQLFKKNSADFLRCFVTMDKT